MSDRRDPGPSLHDVPFTLPRLAALYAAGVGPDAVIAEVFRRIEAAADPGIFLHLADPDVLRAEARALGAPDPARPLWGIPFAVKDNIDVAGMPTTCACPAFAYAAAEDAHAVARLRAAGAIPVGKTNLDQFATGLVGVRTPYPAPRNAVDPAIVPGGSSSGSAVAVARGIVPFAIGTDTAGSGRVPAGFNNIVGLKPSLGAVSATGLVPICRTLDTASVFALTVEDAFAVFTEIAGYDPLDAFSRRLPSPVLRAAAPGLRVAVPDAASRRFFGDDAQAASFEAAIASLEELGCRVVPVDFAPFYETAALLYEGPWIAERFTVVEELLRDSPDALHPVTRTIIGAADGLTAADAFRGFYRLAELKRAIAPVLEAVDLLCVPTIPRFRSVAQLEADPIGPNAELGTYTNFVNLLDLCGIAVPVAARRDNRPGSVTLLAEAGCDGRIAGVAAALQAQSGARLGATGWSWEPGVAASAGPADDEIAVAMVGAHMRGLPLNGEVTGLGGRFLFEGATAPCYRFYALAGGPPKRPGLVRAETGGSIALEVWALPRSRFADFMSGIPAPLGIGTIELADGSEVKGFLCEPAGLAQAEDITGFGGWRRYLEQAALLSHQG